jgi:hypothetical protein
MSEQSKPVAIKKNNWIRRIVVFLLLVFIAIQFFQPSKNNNDFDLTNDISKMVAVPDSVQSILKSACYDCHSNNTEYPWYSNVQPVAWWLNDHVEEGKQHLNFNEFVSIQPRNGKSTRERQLKKIEEIKETIEEGEMPLTSYTWLHAEARLSETQKKLIYAWVDSAMLRVAALPAK